MVHLTLEDLPIEMAEKVLKLLKKEGYEPKTKPKTVFNKSDDGEDRPPGPPR